MKKMTVSRLAKTAAVAAIYAVLTVALPLSYGELQFRFAEILTLLCFYNRDYIISLALGTAIANIFSPFAIIDVPVGTLATVIAVILIWKSRNIIVAGIFPVISNGLIIGAELTFMYGTPFLWSSLSVAAGEAAVLAAGVVLFATALQRNKTFMALIGCRKPLRVK